MSFGHNRTARRLARQLFAQLPEDEFDVLQSAGHTAIPGGNSYIPDVAVVPASSAANFIEQPRTFESFRDALPFVGEIWSPSTGNYNIDHKIPGYPARGDLEIWRVHPFDRIVTGWRRDADGRYVESSFRAGTVALHALPHVSIDLDALWV